MAAQTISGSFNSVKDLAGLHKPFAKNRFRVQLDLGLQQFTRAFIEFLRNQFSQQVAAPKEIYDHPANIFVAGFIGTPTMNFFPATVEDHMLSGTGFRLKLEAAPKLGRVIAGLRPEALKPAAPSDELPMDMKVDVVEVMGSDQYIYGQVGEETLTARLEPHFKVAPGDRLRLRVDTDQLHLFDPETELAVN